MIVVILCKMVSLEQVEALHRKYAATEAGFVVVYSHCQAVADVAMQLAPKDWPDEAVARVRAGALLHDIGAYAFDEYGGQLDAKNYIQHGVRGAEILKREGFDEQFCRFCSCHTGVGLTKELIVRLDLPLPHWDFVAETAEERLVMYADKFNTKNNPPNFMSYGAYRKYVAKFGAELPAKFDALAEEFGKPDLETLSKKYGQIIDY